MYRNISLCPDFVQSGSFWESTGFEDIDLVWGSGVEVPSIMAFKIPRKAHDREISQVLPQGHVFSPQELHMLLASDLAKLSRGEQGVVLNSKNAVNEMGLHFYVDPGELSGVLKFVVFAEHVSQKWYFDKYAYGDGVMWNAGSIFIAKDTRK